MSVEQANDGSWYVTTPNPFKCPVPVGATGVFNNKEEAEVAAEWARIHA